VKLLLAAAAVASLTLAVGSSGALANPTKNQFIWRGDALCERVLYIELAPIRDQARVAKALPVAKKWAAGVQLWNDQIRIQEKFTARFRAIGIPRGDAEARRLVNGLDRGIVLARKVRDAFASRRLPPLAAALEAYLEYTATLNGQVRAYGFRVCGG
jgi:hypothetical protein